MIYDFVFLTDDEAKEPQIDTFWFRVGDILDIKEEADINDYLIEKGLLDKPKELFPHELVELKVARVFAFHMPEQERTDGVTCKDCHALHVLLSINYHSTGFPKDRFKQGVRISSSTNKMVSVPCGKSVEASGVMGRIGLWSICGR